MSESFYRFRQFAIPGYMGGGITRYIEKGILPGGFLLAVLEHDLFEAVGRADDENLANLPAYVAYFYNEAPGACHGSRVKIAEWVATVQAKVGAA